MELKYKIKKADSFITVKQVLKQVFGISDRLLLKLKNHKLIFVNDNPVSVNFPVVNGDTIKVVWDFEEDNSSVVPAKMNLNIVYEDEYFLIVNKPANMPVHPSMSNFSNSLSNGVRDYFDTLGLKKKIRPVNRLDKDTSGIVIFAKNEYIQECLIKQMKLKDFKKYYIGICEGIFDSKNGTIDIGILRKENSIIERCTNINGAPSITHYHVLEEYNINRLCLF